MSPYNYSESAFVVVLGLKIKSIWTGITVVISVRPGFIRFLLV